MTVAQVQSERRRASRHQNRVPSPVDDLESGRGRARDGIVSRSSPMLAVLRTFRRAAASDATILITGESGTGKELVARAVHAASHRAKAPMVTVNMSAVPEALVESELFGHIKGSFTSASHDRIGRFEAAHGGTLFIDEIGDLQPSSQPKLLRALETHSVTPVGSSESRACDVRVIAATNRPLEDLVADGTFRDDLYYRLNIVRIMLPPLRARHGDVPLLVDHFVHKFCEVYERPPMEVTDELMEFLASHAWPGNVRELRNCIESMVVMADSSRLTIDNLPPLLRRTAHPVAACPSLPEEATLAEIEMAAITQSLDRCDGNRTRAAGQLGISVRTLQRRLAQSRRETSAKQ